MSAMTDLRTDRSYSSLPSKVCRNQIDPRTVPFDTRSAHRFLRIRRTSPRLETLDAMVEESLEICRHVATPRYQYRMLLIARHDLDHSLVQFSDGRSDQFSFASRGLAKALRGAEGAAFFALTLGKKLDAVIDRTAAEDFATAYMLDGVGSALIHGLLAMLEQEVRVAARTHELKVGKRFSPGFHNWALSRQKHLIEILGANSIGIELSDSYYMRPRHSLTGVFALVRQHEPSNQ